MSMAARAWTPNALVDLPSPKQPRLSSVATSAQQLQARQLPAGETCGDPQSSGRVVTVGGPSTGGKGNNGAGARASKRQRTDRTTLTYWNGRGLCESIRFMLAFTGEEYTECVPGFDGATHLAEPVHMQHLRDEGMLMWNQVPLLCIDGLQLVQSKAAVRYLAEKHDVRGATPAEVAMTDMVAEGIADWKALIGNPFEFRFGAHAQTPAQRHQTSTGNAKYLPLLERRLAKSGTGYLVGATPTYADVLCLEVLDQILGADPSCLSDATFPLTRALFTRMSALPRMAAFMASDRRKSKSQEGIESYKASVNKTLGR